MSLLRTVKGAGRRWHRALVLRKSLARARDFLEGSGNLPEGLGARLSYGWGNEGWAAKPLLLEFLLKELRGFKGTAVECGSGLSSALLSLANASNGTRSVSLEHHREWFDLVGSRLRKLKLDDSGLAFAPLTSYQGFDWYEEHPMLSGLQPFHLVLCDGPPASTPGGRYGLMPRMFSRLAPGALVIVDDSQRPEETRMIARWLEESGGRVAVETTHPTFTCLRVLDGSRTGSV